MLALIVVFYLLLNCAKRNIVAVLLLCYTNGHIGSRTSLVSSLFILTNNTIKLGIYMAKMKALNCEFKHLKWPTIYKNRAAFTFVYLIWGQIFIDLKSRTRLYLFPQPIANWCSVEWFSNFAAHLSLVCSRANMTGANFINQVIFNVLLCLSN